MLVWFLHFQENECGIFREQSPHYPPISRVKTMTNALRSADEQSAAHGSCETCSSCWQCGGLLPKTQVGFGGPPCNVWSVCRLKKLSLWQLQPSKRAAKKGIIGSGSTADVFVTTRHMGFFHSPCCREMRDFPVICGSQSSKRDLSFLKMDF